MGLTSSFRQPKKYLTPTALEFIWIYSKRKKIVFFFENRFLGLQFSDIEFNSEECTAQTDIIDGSMNWKMNYNDCGTNRVS